MKTNRNYHLLLWGQFLGAFGDNAILVVILGPLMEQFKRHLISAEQQSVANIVFTSVLFVPYVLLAPLAGYLNDRFSKTRWLLLGNAVKLAGASVCMAAAGPGQFWKGAGYFIIGIGSCFYSPAKYGVLPEILPRERLVKANGSVELLTLAAILSGSIGGSLLVDHYSSLVCYAVVLAVYGLSMGLNLFMEQTPSCPDIRFSASAGEFFSSVRDLLTQRRLARVLVGTSLFWFCGAMMKMNFQPWGQQALGLQTMTQVSLLGLWLTIGIMIGSVAAGQMYRVGDLRDSRKYGFGLAAAVLLLGAAKWLSEHGLSAIQPFAIAVLIAAGLVGGLFLIPLNAALQAESHQGKLGKTIATQNCLENIAMMAGGVFAYVNVTAKFDPSQLFFGLAAAAGLVVAFLRIPPKSSANGAASGPVPGEAPGRRDDQRGKP